MSLFQQWMFSQLGVPCWHLVRDGLTIARIGVHGIEENFMPLTLSVNVPMPTALCHLDLFALLRGKHIASDQPCGVFSRVILVVGLVQPFEPF